MNYLIDSRSQSADIQVLDDDGLPVLNLDAASFPEIYWSLAGPNAAQQIALVDLASVTTPWTSGGVFELGGGVYRLDLPNAMFVGTGVITLWGEATNQHVLAADILIITSPQVVSVLSGQSVDNSVYCDRVRAQQYFDRRLSTGAWDDASLVDQNKALAQATTLIDQLNFAGTPAVSGQALQFPRGDDTSVPQAVVNACAEIALALLDGVDPNREMKNSAVQQHRFTAVQTQRDTSYVHEWVLAGIPSPVAWNFLKPFLRDPQELTLRRVD